MSGELIAFLVTLLSLFLLGIPMILNRIYLPAQMDLRDVDEASLTNSQKDAFARMDAAFKPLGMWPGKTFSAVNLIGRNINRAYYSSLEPVTALATFMTYVTEDKTEHVENYVEFVTEFSDGAVLNTKNASISNLFVPKAGRVNQNFPGLKDIGELKKLHDRRVPKVSAFPRLSFEPGELFTNMHKDHAEMCQRQVQHNLLRLDPDAERYNSTALLALKGVRNYVNPFADNFTWLKFGLVLAFSVILPTLVSLAFGHVGKDLMALHFILVSACFGVSGVVLGLLLEKKTFIWSFLLGDFPLLFISSGPTWLYPFFMSMLADLVSRVRQSRSKIA